MRLSPEAWISLIDIDILDAIDYVYDIHDVESKNINLLLTSRSPDVISASSGTPESPALLISISEMSYKLLYAFPDEPGVNPNGLYLPADRTSYAKKVHGSYELWGVLCFGRRGSAKPLCVLWGVENPFKRDLQPWCKVVGWSRVLEAVFPSPRGTADTYGQMFRVVVEHEIWTHPTRWVSLAGLPQDPFRQGGSRTASGGSKHRAEIRLVQFLGQDPLLHLTMGY
jgi:hypothetical protein